MTTKKDKDKQFTSAMDDVLKAVITNPLADLEAEEYHPTKLKPMAWQKETLRKQYWEQLQNYNKHITKGIELALEAKVWPESQDPEAVQKRISKPKVLGKFVKDGKTIAEVLAYSNEDLFKLYLLGSKLQSERRYEDATDVLLVLVQLDPSVGVYWNTLGHAYYEGEEYLQAAMSLSFGLAIDDSNLRYYMTFLRSLIALGEIETAKKVITELIEKAEERNKAEEHDYDPFIKTIQSVEKKLSASKD